MATQRDVARAARVSYMTVSRVVNNSPNVREETRERVLRAIQELSYYPNAAARTLSSRKTNNVGIVFPPEEYIVTRPYFIELSVKLEQQLSSRGYHLFLGSIRDDSAVKGLHDFIEEKKVDGLIIFAPSVDDPTVELLAERKVPFVIVHGRARDVDCPCVDTDSAAGTRLAMEHLLELGHRRIAFVTGNMREINARDRLATYREILEARSAAYEPDLVYEGDWSLESGYAAFRRLWSLRARPTAIGFANDQMAIGAVKAAHDRHVSIPGDISITGYDDIKYASFISPPLTTVRQSMDDIARASVDLILESIAHGNRHERIVLKPELIVRSSTGRCR